MAWNFAHGIIGDLCGDVIRSIRDLTKDTDVWTWQQCHSLSLFNEYHKHKENMFKVFDAYHHILHKVLQNQKDLMTESKGLSRLILKCEEKFYAIFQISFKKSSWPLFLLVFLGDPSAHCLWGSQLSLFYDRVTIYSDWLNSNSNQSERNVIRHICHQRSSNWMQNNLTEIFMYSNL